MDILEKKYLCRLCQRYVSEQEISEEHYPARSVGNEDIVAVDIEKLIDSLLSEDTYKEIVVGLNNGQSIEDIDCQYFDEKFGHFPKLTVKAFNGVCRINQSTELLWELEVGT